MKGLIKLYGFWFAIFISFLLMGFLIFTSVKMISNPTYDNCFSATMVIVMCSYIYFRDPKDKQIEKVEEKEFLMKEYFSIEDIVSASFQDELITAENINEFSMGGVDSNEDNVQFSFEEQKVGIESQGIWGFVDENNVIHYWIGKDLPLDNIIHFFGHEIGHRTGKPNTDEFQEEMRAEGFGRVATLAYKFAKHLKNK